jgi:lysozyme
MAHKGIDVHGSKGSIDWRKVRASGVTFAFVKASEGLTFEDERIAANLRDAHAAGVLVGPYHYARPDVRPSIAGALQEANVFVSRIRAAGWTKQKHARPALDLEEGGGDLAGWALAFCLRVEELTKVRPIVYTYSSFASSFLNRGGIASKELAKFPLWLANYGPNDGQRHPVSVAAPWSYVLIHQYTSSGSTPGVGGRCDLNYAELLTPLYASPIVAPQPGSGPRPATAPKRIPKWVWAWLKWRKNRKPAASSGGGSERVQ